MRPAPRADVETISRPSSANAAAIGRFHPYGRRDIRCEYFPGRTRRRLRTREEYDRHPRGSSDSQTSSPNTPASFFDWIRERASIAETPPSNQCGTMRSGRNRAQKPARADSRDPSATAIHARTSRRRMCGAALGLPVRTSGTTRGRSSLSEVRRGPHGRLAWFFACSSQSSLQAEQFAARGFAFGRT